MQNKYKTLSTVEKLIVDNCKKETNFVSSKNDQLEDVFNKILHIIYEGDCEKFNKDIESIISRSFIELKDYDKLFYYIITTIITNHISKELFEQFKYLNEWTNFKFSNIIKAEFVNPEWDRDDRFPKFSCWIDNISFVQWYNAAIGVYEFNSDFSNLSLYIGNNSTGEIQLMTRGNITPIGFFNSDEKYCLDTLFTEYLSKGREVYKFIDDKIKELSRILNIKYERK